MARPKTEWMNEEELKTFLDCYIQHDYTGFRNTYEMVSVDLLDMQIADAIKDHFRLENTLIYEIIKDESDEYIANLFHALNAECYDKDSSLLIENYRWVYQFKEFENYESRKSFLDAMDETITNIDIEDYADGSYYYYLCRHLDKFNISHNLYECWDILPERDICGLYRFIKIEKKELFTNAMTQEKKRKLFGFNQYWFLRGIEDIENRPIIVDIGEFSCLFDQLQKKGYVVKHWKSIIEYQGRVYGGSEKKIKLTARRIEKALEQIQRNAIGGKKDIRNNEIINFVKSL